MKLTTSENEFDEFQLRLIREIVETVRDGLREAGVTDDQALYEATGNLSFSIAAIVDGSRVMQIEPQVIGLDAKDVIPVVTFARERDGDELITAGGGSWMHEYVFGTVDEVFESDDEDSDTDARPDADEG